MPAMLVGALDQGTTSTRFMVFDAAGREVARRQLEHRQILPGPGWVEHDPTEIAARVDEVIAGALRAAGLTGRDLAAIGVTNQRETTIVWDPRTGRPWHHAIVWQDTRTDRSVSAIEPMRSRLIEHTGLPPATYFSALKLRWILNHVEGARDAALRGHALFGTVDTWVIWNLTGGTDGGLHVTDVTNASRTQLMNLRTLDWDDELLALFDIPGRMLPRIHSSSHASAYGTTRANGPVGAEVRIGGDLGDQHAALVGQACFAPGEAKNTYGTGNFMLLNTGTSIVPSPSGLLTTMGYAFAGVAPVYALEGSVAVTGAAVQWLRDQLEIIRSAAEVESLAASVPDSGGIYFVPAFSGLFAPYWRADARGTIVGLSRFHTKAHLARATLEAIGFHTRAVLDAMAQDSGVRLAVMKVDGGATANNLLMQLQADILGVPVVRPVVSETTALGAAYAAGLAAGCWTDLETLRANWKADRQWEPQWSEDQREAAYRGWSKAIARSVDWVDVS
ncbi:MAG TPA: glycerol kinase GlpK [Vicinamibacterales bacterium]|nr:glycerol kinase GlpK [Vicinamibacterales bacterium]